jgi:hypothetical protein
MYGDLEENPILRNEMFQAILFLIVAFVLVVVGYMWAGVARGAAPVVDAGSVVLSPAHVARIVQAPAHWRTPEGVTIVVPVGSTLDATRYSYAVDDRRLDIFPSSVLFADGFE